MVNHEFIQTKSGSSIYNWYEPMILKSYTMKIEYPVKNNSKQVDLKIIHSGKDNGYGGGLSTKSVATSHKCVRKGHI